MAQNRLSRAAAAVRWLRADVTQPGLPARAYDVWHDRAVFHFLTAPEDRAAYVRNVASRFHLVESTKELHQTPFGTTQQFVYCYCTLEAA